MAWSLPRTWYVGEVPTAAEFNANVRDNQNAIGKLLSYTPSWTASPNNPTIGNGTIQGRYFVLEEWCWVQIIILAGTTTAAGLGSYQLTLPILPSVLQSQNQHIYGTLNNAGIARYLIAGFFSGSTVTVNGVGAWPSGGANQGWTSGTPFAFAGVAGDSMNISGIYRTY